MFDNQFKIGQRVFVYHNWEVKDVYVCSIKPFYYDLQWQELIEKIDESEIFKTKKALINSLLKEEEKRHEEEKKRILSL